MRLKWSTTWATCIVGVFLSLTTSAQSEFSVQGGINGGRLSGNSIFKSRLGFDAYISAKKKILPLLEIQAETGISNINLERNFELSIYPAKENIYLDYWQSGLITHLKLTNNIKALSGLHYGYLLLARTEVQQIANIHILNLPNHKYNRHSWALSYGLEYLLSGRLHFGVRYSQHITKLIASQEPNQSNFKSNMISPMTKVHGWHVYIKFSLNKEQKAY